MQFRVNERRLRVPERPRQLVRLFEQRFQYPRVAMPLLHCRIGGLAIQLALPSHVMPLRPRGTLDEHIKRVVVVRSVFLFKGNEIFLG